MESKRPTRKVIPKICQPVMNDQTGSNDANYEGYVVLYVPDFDERQDFFMVPELDDMIDAAAMSSKTGSPINVEDAAKSLGTKRTMAIMKNMRKQLPQWIAEINIKRIDDGFVFDTFDGLRYDSDIGSILQELTTELIGKYRWGNPNMQQG